MVLGSHESVMQYSDERVQGIREISEPNPLKAVRRFVSMVNYFIDSINRFASLRVSSDTLNDVNPFKTKKK